MLANKYRDRIGGFIVKMLQDPVKLQDEYALHQERVSKTKHQDELAIEMSMEMYADGSVTEASHF